MEKITQSLAGRVAIFYLLPFSLNELATSEFYKLRYNKGMSSNFYFWRDNKGAEIDCLQANYNIIKAIEIKTGATLHENFFKNLLYYQKLSGLSNEQLVPVYGGNDGQQRSIASVLSWKDIDETDQG